MIRPDELLHWSVQYYNAEQHTAGGELMHATRQGASVLTHM
jgi:hypothetical protein